MASYPMFLDPPKTWADYLGQGLSSGINSGTEYFLKKKFADIDEEEDLQKENKLRKQRQERIEAIRKGLDPEEYEDEITGFDEYGDPEYKYKRKKKDEWLKNSPKRVIEEAILFDKNIPEIGKNLGIPSEVSGFPVAGGGMAIPNKEGEFLEELSPMKTEGLSEEAYGNMVKQALLNKVGMKESDVMANMMTPEDYITPQEKRKAKASFYDDLKELKDDSDLQADVIKGLETMRIKYSEFPELLDEIDRLIELNKE